MRSPKRSGRQSADEGRKTAQKWEPQTGFPPLSTPLQPLHRLWKVKVTKIGSTGKYNFKRSTIGVGSPIDLEFSTVQFSGTIIQLSTKPIQDHYVKRTVILEKKNAFPWEYDAIQIGDRYFNGKTNTLEIVSKQATDTYTITSDAYGNCLVGNNELRRYIRVKVTLQGQMVNNQFVYAEDQVVIPGRDMTFGASNFVLNNYTIVVVE